MRILSTTRSLILMALVLLVTAFSSKAGGYKIYFDDITVSGFNWPIYNTNFHITYKDKSSEGHVLPLSGGNKEMHSSTTLTKANKCCGTATWKPSKTEGNPALHGGPTAVYYFWKYGDFSDSKMFKVTMELPNLAGKGTQTATNSYEGLTYTVKYRVEKA